MLQSRLVLKTTCALAPLVLAACALPIPDLAPVGVPNRSGPDGLCIIVKEGPDKGKLRVTVKNDGTRVAPPTTTIVEFRGVTTPITVKLPTPQVAAYSWPVPALPVLLFPPTPGITPLFVPIPAACYEPTTGNCYFKITVDAENVVQEVIEGDNTSWGVCSS